MTSVEEIVNVIFGGTVSIEGVCSILVAVWAVIQGVIAWRSKINAIRKTTEGLAKDEQIAAQKEELDKLKSAIAGLASLITDAYLSNANVDPDVKKRLAVQAENIAQIAEFSLSNAADKLIEAATEYAPDTDLIKHAEDLKAEAEAADQILDTVSDAAKAAIEKLNV